MSIQLRPYQLEGERQIRQAYADGFKSVLYVLSTGGGKCLGRNTPVLRYDGSIVMAQDVRTGDLLMGPDSSPRRVISICAGSEMLYRITPTKGDSFVVNESHILSVKMTASRGCLWAQNEVINISISDFLKQSKTFRTYAKIWRTSVDFPPHPFDPVLPPYILGLWLGDGNSSLPTLTTADPEIELEWMRFASNIGMEVRREIQPNNRSVNLHIIVRNGRGNGGIKGGNRVAKALRRLGIMDDKHIPLRYLTGSKVERLELLAGIIDTDGSLARAGFDYISVKPALANGVAFLARSLGFSAYVRQCRKGCQTGAIGTYYRVSISGDLSIVPVRVPRKKAPMRRQIKSVLMTGFTIAPIGSGEYFGFELTGADRLFLLGDFTVTHNTILFASIAHSAMRRAKRVLILCHRIELVDQIVDALKAFDIEPQIIAASYQTSAGAARAATRAIAVASVQTLIRRLDSYAPPTLIICDESHHACAGNSWSQVLRKWPDARILGVTATPCRLDGRGLGAHFDKLILGPSEQELITGGYLVRTRIFAPPLVDTSGLFAPGHIRAGDCKSDEADALINTPAITGDCFSEYMKHTPNEQGLVFCTGVQHAENIARRFRDGGVPAVAMNGGMDKQIRRMAFDDYRRGAIRVLTSMDIFSEGVDCPGARVGIMLRPTQSLTLYRQQRGRILRPAAGKEYGTLIDHVQNCEKPGFVLLPGESDNWELTPDFIRKKKDAKPGIRVCLKCFAASPASARTCVECGAPFPIKAREDIEQREGTLVELTPEELARKRERREQGRTDSLAGLIAIGRIKKYKDPEAWAMHVWRGREAKKLKKESA